MIPQNSERRGDWSPFLNPFIPFPVPFLLVPVCLLFFFCAWACGNLANRIQSFQTHDNDINCVQGCEWSQEMVQMMTLYITYCPSGVLEVYMTGESDVFFWVENLHARYFFGSRDLSRIFFGLKKICVFFWVLSPSELFVSGFRCDQWIRKIFI